MKRLFFILLCLLLLITSSAWAVQGWGPDPNRETLWNKITDGMHTIGQTPTQAKMTEWRLRNQRRIRRIQDMNEARIHQWQYSQ